LQIIDHELFQKAQDTLAKRLSAFNINRERHSNKHLFSTLIKCADCGCSFRRLVYTYKNTYTRWVCSGRNAKGANSCKNKTTIDEIELCESLFEYFLGVISQKPSAIKNITKELINTCKVKDNNELYETGLRDKLSKLQKSRKKLMDMYTDDLITREELQEKMRILNSDVEKAEDKLKLLAHSPDKDSRPEDLLSRTFTKIEDIVSIKTLTNSGLKQVIQKIVVNDSGNCDIFLITNNHT